MNLILHGLRRSSGVNFIFCIDQGLETSLPPSVALFEDLSDQAMPSEVFSTAVVTSIDPCTSQSESSIMWDIFPVMKCISDIYAQH